MPETRWLLSAIRTEPAKTEEAAAVTEVKKEGGFGGATFCADFASIYWIRLEKACHKESGATVHQVATHFLGVGVEWHLMMLHAFSSEL